MIRYTIRRADHLEYGFWLLFDEDGSVSMTRGEPTVSRGQRAMSASVALPLSLFKTPKLSATITVPDAGAAAFEIDVEAASAALKGVVGVDIDVVVHPQLSQVDDALAQCRINELP